MNPATVEALKETLDDFLDNPDDTKLQEEYVDMLKERTVYSFLSVLHRIKYKRIFELIKVTNNTVRMYSDKSIEIESESESQESSSSETSEDTETSNEEPKSRTGTAFDLLMDEEC